MDPKYEGGCLCGAVRYTARGPALRTLVCHCRFCQRMTGSSLYAQSTFDIDAVQIHGVLHSYSHRSVTSGKAVHVHFCPTCGTTVSLTFERWPNARGISRGTLDDPDAVIPVAHIWTESAQSGVIVPADVDCYRQARTQPDGTPAASARHARPTPAREAGWPS